MVQERLRGLQSGVFGDLLSKCGLKGGAGEGMGEHLVLVLLFEPEQSLALDESHASLIPPPHDEINLIVTEANKRPG